MQDFELKALDFKRCRNWLKRANDIKDDDPVTAFISAWISFNHYYSTFASENDKAFHSWTQTHFNNRQGDKAQWVFLLNSSQFIKLFAEYRAKYPECFEVSIRLPVINMLNGSPVPQGIQGTHELKNLSDEQIFSVIYQIRNNLFHGSKDPIKSERDKHLCTIAGEFMIPFLARLVTNTGGEVMNAYEDNDVRAVRNYVLELAAA